MTDNKATIAVIGGTGNEGKGLALRWAYAGYRVIIGSRGAEKAEAAASELNDILARDGVAGRENPAAAREADLIVLTVPYAAHQPTLESIRAEVQGKILVDVTVPLKPPEVYIVNIPAGRSAAEEAQAILGADVRVVSAFQNVSAHHLKRLDQVIDCDVLVCGDDQEARAAALALVEAAGMKGINAGPLANSVVSEGLTAMLISINRAYGVKDSGIRITGIG